MTGFKLDYEAAARLPERVKFGTSSWTYPGWQNLIYYNEYPSTREFNRSSLSEYARCPWFRTVGVDSSFYGPIKPATLTHYAAQVPEEFRWVLKMWERLTIPRYPNLPRYGKDAGTTNSCFLDPALCLQEVLKPLESPAIFTHVGPLVLQFPTISPEILSQSDFVKALDTFLGALPSKFQFAVEVRNPEYLRPNYFETLNAHGATHCFNHWHRMPSLKDQMHAAAAAGGLTARFYVARILTPLGISYESAVKLFQPYSEIRRPNLEMRVDVIRLARRAIERDVDAFILVNNRSEGCAPLTIAQIGKALIEQIQ